MDQLPYLPKEQQDAILNGPALAAPKGVTPDFENPPNNNELGHAVTAICIAVATVCCLVRIYARNIRMRQFFLEDALMLIGFGFFVAYVYALYRLMFDLGIFVHQWDLLLKDLIDLQFILHIGGTFYSITLCCLKAAIALEWSRIFVPHGTRTGFWWVCVAVAAVQIGFCIAMVVSLQLVCRPIESIWDFTVAGTCYDKSKLEISTASISLASDVVIFILPQKVIWELHMSVQKKLSVAVIFSVGILACVSAVFRLVVTLTYADSPDVTYNVAPLALWALAECTCGFLVFCTPSAPKAFSERGVLTRFKESMRSWTGASMKSTSKLATGVSSSHYHDGSGHLSRSDNYVAMDDSSIAMGKMGDGDSTEELRVSAAKSGAIVRTMQFSTTEDYIDSPRSNGNFSRQHPWSQGGRRRDMA